MMCLPSKKHVRPLIPVKIFSGLLGEDRDFGSWDTKIPGGQTKAFQNTWTIF